MPFKTILITGSNICIGYETAKDLLQSPKATYHIYLTSRSHEKGQTALKTLQTEVPSTKSTISLLTLDLTSDASIEGAYNTVRATHDHIDILINNAGKLSLRESFNKACDTNVSGTHVLTHNFMPFLLRSSDPRLIFVAGLSQIMQAAESYFPTPPLPAGWPKEIVFETIGYRCSKTALDMLMLN
ncbi:hypothetical protein BBP40_006349 [Aspergillus hancockii]|nr:hypothetical protein BBP40_006349 [Aspergillus hancockii]